MEIALMRSKIIIQKQTVSVDSIGNRTNTWSDYLTCRAYVNTSYGYEHHTAGQTVDTATLTFTVRFCEALKTLCSDGFRIVFNGEIYNITYIDDYQFRHETLKLTAERVNR